MSVLIALDDAGATYPAAVGQKAANLARLLQAGLPVPTGLVIGIQAFESGRLSAKTREELQARLPILGGPFAVRSSGVLEDLDGHSAAGLYLTVLDAEPHEVVAAAERVHASGVPGGDHDRPANDRSAPGLGPVAVLIQPMLQPSAAGVAFTADPMTGERETAVIRAVRGRGDALVAGLADGEEWRVQASTATRKGHGETVLAEDDAIQVAALARAAASILGGPQDVEWAILGGSVHLLQSRPMTALPDVSAWDPPPGIWARNVRLGEWLGAPVSALFESWLLPTIEETMHAEFARLVGQPAPRPLHAVVNGWYYYSLAFLPVTLSAIVRTAPGLLLRLARDPRRVAPVLPPLARFGVDLYVREWREQLLPDYLARTERASAELASASPQQLVEIIDELAASAGSYFTSMTFVAGYAWKTEVPFARFWRTHLTHRVHGHPQELLRGLLPPAAPEHSVQSLDWALPTLDELGLAVPVDAAAIERPDLRTRRSQLLGDARDSLTGRSRRRFDRLLAEAERAAILRETQIADFTRPWPVMRRALARLGGHLVSTGVIRAADDIYELRRAELLLALAGRQDSLADQVTERRRRRQRQASLAAPLTLGKMPKALDLMLAAADRAIRDGDQRGAAGAHGTPASPGRATGRARVVRDLSDANRIEPGDVLVCPVTAPAWARLFDRVAAVVADVGSPAAHASILAREFGIPAIVGTGDGTARIPDGWIATVDGGAGIVTWQPPDPTAPAA